MYIAYYQRPADPDGLQYWVDQIETHGSWQAVAAAFGSPDNAEYQALYGDKTRAELIAELYQSVFSRAAVQEEIAFWEASEHSDQNLAFAIINGAQNDDLALINNKVAFSEFLIAQVADNEAYVALGDNVKDLLDAVEADTEVTAESVADALAAALAPNHFFTLTEIRTIEVLDDTIPTQMVTYWGNPETGDGVPADQVWGTVRAFLSEADDMADYLFDVTGSLEAIKGITISGTNDGLQGGQVPGFGDDKQGDYTGNYEITVTLSDGTFNTAIVELTQAQFEYLNGLLFDANGNSRLFEKEVAYMVDSGKDDVGGDAILVPAVIEGGTLITDYPIILTPTQNNGGTEESGKTSDANDLIVAGRLELLHGAYIDGGAGVNTLEIDAKGHFAQPKQLLNIQHIKVENLPNIYTTVGDDGDVWYGYPDVQEGVLADPNQNSIIDLSRAVDIETLTVTEGNFQGLNGLQIAGALTLTGIRNGVATTLDGGFSQNVTLNYGELSDAAGLNLVFNNLSMGDADDADDDEGGAQLIVAHNAETLNIESAGAGNYIYNGDLGGELRTLNITGDAHLYIEGNLSPSFHEGTPVTIDASANTGGVDLTIGDHGGEVTFIGTAEADDQFQANNNGKAVTINGGNGDNEFSATSGDVVTITAGDGNNTITTDDSDTVSITTGEGNDVISSVRGESVSINAAGGDNQITVSAEEMSITTGAGNDTVVVSGMNFPAGLVADGNLTALVNIDTGTGEDTVVLGRDLGPFDFGIVALEGSSISGENITLYVENASDLRAAELSGIQNVVLNFDVEHGILTLTDAQFAAIGAENFAVAGSPFYTSAQVKIIVTESTSLTDLGVDNLPVGVDLILEIQDGVTLEMTAEQLHTRVAEQGVTLADDNNGDQQSGSVLITNAGLDFDPFNNRDDARSIVDGVALSGGSLSSDFATDTDNSGAIERDEWGQNVLIDRNMNGYDRPADVPSYSRLVINTDDMSEIGPFSTIETFLRITGESDLTFTPVEGGIDDWGRPIEGGSAIALGVDDGEPTNGFIVDFSSVGGVVNNLTLSGFENADAIYGNGARVNVELTDHVGTTDAGLVSSGVHTYVVTGLGQESYNFFTCETTKDLEALGLRGNFGKQINFLNTERGVDFLMEVDYSKQNGYSVGTLNGQFARAGADAVVNVVGLAALPAGETQKVAGIELVNAATATINVEGGNTVINALDTGAVTALTVTADANLTLPQLNAGLEMFDASGVTGELNASVDLWNGDAGLVFVGAAGATSLTIDDAGVDAIDAITGAGEISLTIGDGTGTDAVNLSEASLANITSVTLNDGSTLTLTMEQADTIGAENFHVAEGASATLNLEGLNDQEFALANYDVEGNLSVTLTLANEPVVTLHPNTDLTGLTGLVIPEGTTLELTAAQFQQLEGTGTLTGAGNVHITDLTQAAVGVAGADLKLGQVTVDGTVTITLAESVDLSAAELKSGASVTYNIGDNITLILGDIDDADGVQFAGGAESMLQFNDAFHSLFTGIDASGFDITYLRILNALVDGANVDLMFSGLPGTVTKLIYNGNGWVSTIDQTVTIEEATTVDGHLVFNPPASDTEIANFTLNLEGGAVISDNLRLSTNPKFVDSNGNGHYDGGDTNLMRSFLQSLTINSTGTAVNPLNGDTTNIIKGAITPMGVGGQSAENNLLSVTITGDQALVVEDGIVFNSVTGDDDFFANDNENAVATLNVESDASVVLGVLDTSDDDVVELVVNQTGAGDLTFTLNPDNLGADDQLTINGSATAQTTIVVADGSNDLNLSDDTLVNVDAIVLEDAADLILTQAQFNDIGAANFSLADNASDADIDLVAFEGAVVFDATALEAGIDIETITMAPGAQVMDPATNLTGVAQIFVPEGGSLTLTADQFAQLDGTGSIVGVGTQDFTVTITGLDQADVDAGLNLTGIESTNIIIDVDGSVVNLHETTVLGNVGNLTFLLDDNAILGLADIEQLSPRYTIEPPTTGVEAGSGLTVIGGTGSSVELQFTQTAGVYWFEAFDASGIQTDTIRLLNDLVKNRNIELLQGIDSDVEVIIFETLLDFPGYLTTINRVVEVEPGVTIDGFIVFNDSTDDSEIRTLQIDLQGDATVDGSIYLTTRDKASDKQPRNFETLTINSLGTDANTIDGDITPFSALPWTEDNRLLKVEINADQALTITGDIVFNGLSAAENTANLTITGTADVTVEQLDVNDDEVDTLVINNDGGTLTVTGASPAIDGDLEVLDLNGSGNIVFGTIGEGVDSHSISLIDASDLTGNLTLDELREVDGNDFSFIAGEGVTTLTLHSWADLGDNDGSNDAGVWNFDLSRAAEGSEFHLQAFDYEAGSVLNINMGEDGVLFIDESMDLSDLDLTILGDQPIVLADDVTLTLTAAQASGLNIVEGTDVGNDGYNGSIEIIDLGDYADLNQNGSNDDPAELIDYDFSGLQVTASATLADKDVTLSVNTDLGDVVINLRDLDDNAGGNPALTGQTIRFATEEQAARTINSDWAGVVNLNQEKSTNVIWLFDSVSGPVDTSGYDPDIARLWILEALANGANVEQLFTSLPSTIIRVDFADLSDLPDALDPSVGRGRVVELASFTNLPDGLSFSDEDRLEHVDELTIRMGGEVTLGNVEIDNIIDMTVNQASINFTSLVIDSLLADNTNDLLAADGYDENTNVPPAAANVIGDISVGTEEGLELLSVTLNTVDNLGMDGNELEIGTIYFAANATNSATLIVTGDNDVTIKSLDTSDAEVTGLAITNSGAGSLTITGGSPAFDGGMAAGNTESLTIDTDDGDVTLGSGEYAGVAGEELSMLTVSTNDGKVNLGTLALIDSNDDGAAHAFTLSATVNGLGTVTARLGTANVNGDLVAPTLDAGSTWNFSDIALTIAEGTVVNGTLALSNVAVTIEGDVDLSNATLDFNGVDIFVPAGESLTLTSDQIAAAESVTGEGTVFITGEVNTDAVVDLDLSYIQTVGIDLSGITVIVPQANPVEVTLKHEGALDDNGQPAGFNVVGSPFNDSIIGSELDDTFDMGAGDDTIKGGEGSDTYLITAGDDIVIGLRSQADDGDGSTTEEQDVLIVSAGASVTAEGVDEFVATAATVNNADSNADVVLVGASGDNSVIDVSKATGSTGFTLIGGLEDGSDNGANTLIGSANDDIINGGDSAQVADSVDILTGNGGNDRFVFNVIDSVPAELTGQNEYDGSGESEAVDTEVLALNSTISAGTIGASDDTVSITYTLDRTNGSTVAVRTVSLTGVDLGNYEAVMTAIAASLNGIDGISAAAVDAGTGDWTVVATGDNGNGLSFDAVTGAVNSSLNIGRDDTASTVGDTTQVDIVTVSKGAVAGEEYTITATLKGGVEIISTYRADGEMTVEALAEALATAFSALAIGKLTATANADTITFTGTDDQGGFTLDIVSEGGINGTGTSPFADPVYAQADIITDFTSGEDVIEIGVAAGTVSNTVEAATAAIDFGEALLSANTNFGLSNGAVQYYFTWMEEAGVAGAVDGVIDEDDTVGLLFIDANKDGVADGLIRLVGVDADNFNAVTDIVA